MLTKVTALELAEHRITSTRSRRARSYADDRQRGRRPKPGSAPGHSDWPVGRRMGDRRSGRVSRLSRSELRHRGTRWSPTAGCSWRPRSETTMRSRSADRAGLPFGW